jgi:hypothetical protein
MLAARGHDVIVADIDAVNGERVADSIGGAFVQLNVSDPDAWKTVPVACRNRVAHRLLLAQR